MSNKQTSLSKSNDAKDMRHWERETRTHTHKQVTLIWSNKVWIEEQSPSSEKNVVAVHTDSLDWKAQSKWNKDERLFVLLSWRFKKVKMIKKVKFIALEVLITAMPISIWSQRSFAFSLSLLSSTILRIVITLHSEQLTEQGERKIKKKIESKHTNASQHRSTGSVFERKEVSFFCLHKSSSLSTHRHTDYTPTLCGTHTQKSNWRCINKDIEIYRPRKTRKGKQLADSTHNTHT